MPAFAIPENLAFDNYTDLVAAINDWLDRSDLSGVAQQLIALCEARLRRELQPYFGEATATVDVTDGTGSLPPDFARVMEVVYDGRVIPNLPDVGWVPTGSRPVGYRIEGGNIRVFPETDATLTVRYDTRLAQLSEGNPSTELLSEHPDLYFYGSLMFAEGYVANDRRAMLFKQLWDEALVSTKGYMARQRYGGRLKPNLGVYP